MVNKKGQSEIQAIIGGILSLFFVIIFISAIIPVFKSITGQDDLQNEINNLNNQNAQLRQEIDNKNIKVSQLRSLLESLNSTIEEKDDLIFNLSGQLTEKEKQIENLTNELKGYQEKEYLPLINNNYYNILNYVEKIENRFYIVNLSIGLISITLLGIVIKLFGLDISLKLFFRKFKKRNKEAKGEESK